jgi:hypothetical protein
VVQLSHWDSIYIRLLIEIVFDLQCQWRILCNLVDLILFEKGPIVFPCQKALTVLLFNVVHMDVIASLSND